MIQGAIIRFCPNLNERCVFKVSLNSLLLKNRLLGFSHLAAQLAFIRERVNYIMDLCC